MNINDIFICEHCEWTLEPIIDNYNNCQKVSPSRNRFSNLFTNIITDNELLVVALVKLILSSLKKGRVSTTNRSLIDLYLNVDEELEWLNSLIIICE